jgi:hypothetical protein
MVIKKEHIKVMPNVHFKRFILDPLHILNDIFINAKLEEHLAKFRHASS